MNASVVAIVIKGMEFSGLLIKDSLFMYCGTMVTNFCGYKLQLKSSYYHRDYGSKF